VFEAMMRTFPEVWVALALISVGSVFAAIWGTASEDRGRVGALSGARLIAQFAAWRIYEIGDQWPWTVAAMLFTVSVPFNALTCPALAAKLYELNTGKLPTTREAFLLGWSAVMWRSILVLLPVTVLLRVFIGNRIFAMGVGLLLLPVLILANEAALHTLRSFPRGRPG
jgi:hypothetical protein